MQLDPDDMDIIQNDTLVRPLIMLDEATCS